MRTDKNINNGWNLESSYSKLPRTFFAKTNPIPVKSPELIIFNKKLAISLGLNENMVECTDSASAFAGNVLPEGAVPIAQAYAGHQYGHFTMLGDGRAVLIGEQISPSGERFDIQLKGSGQTPFSRGGDGRATLGPMLREYIISEAMYGLGIPTTRSLAVVKTGEKVLRETILAGAILTRVASSHIRVGTFEYISKWGSIDELRSLADYTIDRHFKDVELTKNRYISLLRKVIEKQAELVARWQLVGFVHGVINTDNVAVCGETIDYGPCAFMDHYNPQTVFSSIDRYGRYSYSNQPNIFKWNLTQFAKTLLPLIHTNLNTAIDLVEETISEFDDIYKNFWLKGMRSKLGLFNEEDGDELLINNLLEIMHKSQSDYTNTFIGLTFDFIEDENLINMPEFKDWHELWKERLTRQKQSKVSFHQLMLNSNPAVIPRNHRVEEALEAAVVNQDYSVMEGMLKVILKPYEHSQEHTFYSTLPAQCNLKYRTFCGT